jgi:hypothetical protein
MEERFGFDRHQVEMDKNHARQGQLLQMQQRMQKLQRRIREELLEKHQKLQQQTREELVINQEEVIHGNTRALLSQTCELHEYPTPQPSVLLPEGQRSVIRQGDQAVHVPFTPCLRIAPHQVHFDLHLPNSL